MKPSDLIPLRAVATQIYDRDLAVFSQLKAEDAALVDAIAAVMARAAKEAALAEADPAAQRAAEKFRQAAAQRAKSMARERAALAEKIEAARQAGVAALGRRQAIDILSRRARVDAQKLTERREETPPDRRP